MRSERLAKLVNDLRESGMEWADKNAAANLLEEGRRSLLAQLIVEKMGRGSSKAKAEEQARMDESFRKATKGMLEARRTAERANVAYKVAQAAIDLYRTEMATRRAEMENIHGT